MRHLNLLPDERKAVLQKELVLSAALRLSLSTFWAIVGATAIGLGVYGVILVMDWQMEETAEAILIRRVQEYGDWREAVSQQNELLHAIDARGRERVTWSEILLNFMGAVPPGVSVQTLTADVQANESILVVTGQSLTRNTLVLFEERLRKLSWAKQVDAPRKNLLKRTNAEYEFKIHLKDNFDRAENIEPEVVVPN